MTLIVSMGHQKPNDVIHGYDIIPDGGPGIDMDCEVRGRGKLTGHIADETQVRVVIRMQCSGGHTNLWEEVQQG